ncbi:MAG TPA: tetratricopeptide repeat protein [Candidatus Limnocylindrales bacterium]|nr:tetratricopeptide repeat protein [Candidatus Limnocylindrales bacterium]
MKIHHPGLYYFTTILLAGAFHLLAANTTNTPSSFQESWETISNRWGPLPLDKIEQAGEKGDCTAQYYLGCVYDDGIGVSKNPVKSFKWMNLAAQQGMAWAERQLGWAYLNGLGVDSDASQAFVWYQKAAQQSDAKSQMNLGWMYEHGSGVPQDYDQAAKFYRLAAEQGHAMAQNNLGWLYKNGLGVPDDPVEAVKWFQKSAAQGEKLGAQNLAWIYASGVYGPSNTFGQGAKALILSGGVAPNHELAEKWMRKAVDLISAEGQCQYAELLYGEFDNEGHQDSTRFADAGEWFKKSAEQGYAKAQFELADMYTSGQLGDDHRSNCIPWYLKAAAQGNADAQAKIGKLSELYPNSELLKSVNPIDSLKQAAEQNNLNAQFDLAFRYHHGDGVPKDDVEAFKWMEKASQQDLLLTRAVNAQYYLGVMYETGEGVTKDLTNAFRQYLFYRDVVLSGNQPPFIGNMPEPYCRLGQMFEKGEGVPQDDSLAATNYFMALKFGFFPTSDDTARCTAIDSLLNLYIQGRGLPADTNMISQQLNEIKGNHPITTAKGQFLFGQVYEQGKIVSQDLVEAAVWLRLAASQHLDEARKELEQVESKLSSSQIEAAKNRFDDLNKKIEQANISYKHFESYRRSKAW